MYVSDFEFELPENLIARYPLPKRRDSRLLHLSKKSIVHRHFSDFVDQISETDLLIFNNTKVVPARLHGHKESGGAVELLLERFISVDEALVHLKASKSPKPGSLLSFAQGAVQARVVGREGELYHLAFSDCEDLLSLFKQFGEMPLPPYLERGEEALDIERYQTVYAKVDGAVAAPTAGLHFDEEILEALKLKGVAIDFVTLHVGAGTFQPIRVDRVEEHVMHEEYIEVGESVVQAVQACKARGGRVIAIGTTSLRSLEAASQKTGDLQVFRGFTDLFIYPGYQFKTIDGLLTNFHLPRSSLLMLVAALAGLEEIKTAYQEAIAKEYRFFSYGDAMLIA